MTVDPSEREGEIAARLGAATAGPWVQGTMPEWEDYKIVSNSVREDWEWDPDYDDGEDRATWQPPRKSVVDDPSLTDEDFDLIANAPTDLAYLLAEVGRLREALGRIARMTTVPSTGWGGNVHTHSCGGHCHVCTARAALAPSPIEGGVVSDEMAEVEALQGRVAKMERALKAFDEWDMLTLDPVAGRGVATADAPWARLLIRDAPTHPTLTPSASAKGEE